MDFTVEQNLVYKRNEGGKLMAEVAFPDAEAGTVAITHTFVDESLRGQGIADRLLQTAVTEIQTQGKKVTPICSYAVKWFEMHPEHSNLLIRNK